MDYEHDQESLRVKHLQDQVAASRRDILEMIIDDRTFVDRIGTGELTAIERMFVQSIMYGLMGDFVIARSKQRSSGGEP